MDLKNKGQISIETLIILGVLIIIAVVVGVFFLGSVNQSVDSGSESSDAVDSITDDFTKDLNSYYKDEEVVKDLVFKVKNNDSVFTTNSEFLIDTDVNFNITDIDNNISNISLVKVDSNVSPFNLISTSDLDFNISFNELGYHKLTFTIYSDKEKKASKSFTIKIIEPSVDPIVLEFTNPSDGATLSTDEITFKFNIIEGDEIDINKLGILYILDGTNPGEIYKGDYNNEITVTINSFGEYIFNYGIENINGDVYSTPDNAINVTINEPINLPQFSITNTENYAIDSLNINLSPTTINNITDMNVYDNSKLIKNYNDYNPDFTIDDLNIGEHSISIIVTNNDGSKTENYSFTTPFKLSVDKTNVTEKDILEFSISEYSSSQNFSDMVDSITLLRDDEIIYYKDGFTNSIKTGFVNAFSSTNDFSYKLLVETKDTASFGDFSKTFNISKNPISSLDTKIYSFRDSSSDPQVIEDNNYILYGKAFGGSDNYTYRWTINNPSFTKPIILSSKSTDSVNIIDEIKDSEGAGIFITLGDEIYASISDLNLQVTDKTSNDINHTQIPIKIKGNSNYFEKNTIDPTNNEEISYNSKTDFDLTIFNTYNCIWKDMFSNIIYQDECNTFQDNILTTFNESLISVELYTNIDDKLSSANTKINVVKD